VNSAEPEQPSDDDGSEPVLGEVRRLGDYATGSWYLDLFEDGSALGQWNWSEKPLRKPVWFDRTADGGLVPRARGEARQRILNEFGDVLDQVGPFHPPNRPDVPTAGEFDGARGGHQRGRPRGNRLDRALTRRTMAEVRAEHPDETVTACYGIVGDQIGIAFETVKDHLYRNDPEDPQPVCAPRPINPAQPWKRDWAAWTNDLRTRLAWLNDEVAQVDSTTLPNVKAEFDQLQADIQEFEAAWAHAWLAQVIYSARCVTYAVDLFQGRGRSLDDIKHSLGRLVLDADAVDEVYKLGVAFNAADPDAPLYVHPHWLEKIEQYLPNDRD
jgi:hypothetical protein